MGNFYPSGNLSKNKHFHLKVSFGYRLWSQQQKSNRYNVHNRFQFLLPPEASCVFPALVDYESDCLLMGLFLKSQGSPLFITHCPSNFLLHFPQCAPSFCPNQFSPRLFDLNSGVISCTLSFLGTELSLRHLLLRNKNYHILNWQSLVIPFPFRIKLTFWSLWPLEEPILGLKAWTSLCPLPPQMTIRAHSASIISSFVTRLFFFLCLVLFMMPGVFLSSIFFPVGTY